MIVGRQVSGITSVSLFSIEDADEEIDRLSSDA